MGWKIGLAFGPLVGLSCGLTRLLAGEAVVEQRTRVNQGTRRSMKMGATFSLIGALIGGLAIGLIMDQDFIEGATIFGPIFGLIGGGLFSIKHFVLRFVMWMNHSAPMNYPRFLDYAADKSLLRKVGSGYVFIHRMLMEYFAALSKEDSARQGVRPV
jgi:hypothetical protein